MSYELVVERDDQCDTGAEARVFDEDEKYTCLKCRDSGMSKHPGLYCDCKCGVDLLKEHQREDMETGILHHGDGDWF